MLPNTDYRTETQLDLLVDVYTYNDRDTDIKPSKREYGGRNML